MGGLRQKAPNPPYMSYSNNPRVADAQLKLGLIYAAQLKWTEARALFKKVATQYPGTASAQLANEQLK